MRMPSEKHQHLPRRVLLVVAGVAAIAGTQLRTLLASRSVEAPVAFVAGPDPRAATPVLNSETSCSSCHTFDAGMSHPVNVRPSMPTPVSLPLQNGRMTCTTCHSTPASHPSRTEPVQLRGGAGLCTQCHQPARSGSRAVHALSMPMAHLATGTTLARGRLNAAASSAESTACMSCHDGTTGSDAGSHLVLSGAASQPTEHPVGVPLVATDRTRHGDFHLSPRPDPRLRLFEGKMSCGTCHSVYSREPAQLVMSNQHSRLCLSCHTQ